MSYCFSTLSACFGYCCCSFFFLQAEDGIRDLVRSRGLGDVYKRQEMYGVDCAQVRTLEGQRTCSHLSFLKPDGEMAVGCLLYTSDAADERSSVDLGGRRLITKKKKDKVRERRSNSRNEHTTRHSANQS